MNANTATAQTTTTFETGDVVWGRPVHTGVTQSRRKGIVLGRFSDNASELVVWWFGKGPVSITTVDLMFARELKKAGDIFDFGARKASALAKGCTGYDRARSLRGMLVRHAQRMGSIGVK